MSSDPDLPPAEEPVPYPWDEPPVRPLPEPPVIGPEVAALLADGQRHHVTVVHEDGRSRVYVDDEPAGTSHG